MIFGNFAYLFFSSSFSWLFCHALDIHLFSFFTANNGKYALFVYYLHGYVALALKFQIEILHHHRIHSRLVVFLFNIIQTVFEPFLFLFIIIWLCTDSGTLFHSNIVSSMHFVSLFSFKPSNDSTQCYNFSQTRHINTYTVTLIH